MVDRRRQTSDSGRRAGGPIGGALTAIEAELGMKRRLGIAEETVSVQLIAGIKKTEIWRTHTVS